MEESLLVSNNLRAWSKTMLSGKLTLFGVFSKVPEFLLVAFKLLEIHWAAFCFAVLRFVFEKKRMQKTQEVWLVCNASLLSLLRQTKGFFCFSFNKRSQKHAAAKTWVFCIRFFSKTKRKTAKKKCSPMYF